MLTRKNRSDCQISLRLVNHPLNITCLATFTLLTDLIIKKRTCTGSCKLSQTWRRESTMTSTMSMVIIMSYLEHRWTPSLFQGWMESSLKSQLTSFLSSFKTWLSMSQTCSTSSWLTWMKSDSLSSFRNRSFKQGSTSKLNTSGTKEAWITSSSTLSLKERRRPRNSTTHTIHSPNCHPLHTTAGWMSKT